MSFPSDFSGHSDKQAILSKYKGTPISDLPTPCFVINRKQFEENSKKMLENSSKYLNCSFRCHVKTHKTTEGVRLQLHGKTDKVVISTMAEVKGLEPLIEEGLINDIHYSLPTPKCVFPELYALQKKVKHLRIMIDDIDQIKSLIEFSKENSIENRWSIFVKIDMGTKRAGFPLESEELDEFLTFVLTDEESKKYISIYGVYCHAGHSYSSKSEEEAKDRLLDEIEAANTGALRALKIDPELKLILSVGATPTAHSTELLQNGYANKLSGELELHAGNYCCCDLQQVSTKCVSIESVSARVYAQVCSTYKNRGQLAPGEQLINSGVLALAREASAFPGFGNVVFPTGHGDWIVGRLSQEHGILVPANKDTECKFFTYGETVGIVPQHACIAAACYPYYYIVDDWSEGKVVDIWVPWRAW